jgi:hypothetical protein
MISFLPSFPPKKGARARAGERTRAGVTKNDFLPSFPPEKDPRERAGERTRAGVTKNDRECDYNCDCDCVTA